VLLHRYQQLAAELGRSGDLEVTILVTSLLGEGEIVPHVPFGALPSQARQRAVARVEDGELLVGRGRFVDNVGVAGQTTIAFQRSPHAHARIVAIDAEAARSLPGVLAVYTGAELAAAGVKPIPTTAGFKRADGRTTVSPPRRALAHEFARYVGEPVVAVVAESAAAARDAIDSVVVEYQELPAVVDAVAATTAGAAAVTPDAVDNIAAEMRHGDAAATAAAFARAAVRIELELVNQRVALYMLAKLGYQVDAAITGVEALARLGESRGKIVKAGSPSWIPALRARGAGSPANV